MELKKNCAKRNSKNWTSKNIHRQWKPKCIPSTKPQAYREPIDGGVCVFCVKSLYTNGYIHELFEKVPLIKKQSEIYGDDVAWRIGVRTRVMVHKNCYESYINALSHNEKKECDFELKHNDVNEKGDEDEDSNFNCGIEVERDEENKTEDKEKKAENISEEKKDEHNFAKKQNKSFELPEMSGRQRKQHFCLKKYEVPKIDSGKLFKV